MIGVAVLDHLQSSSTITRSLVENIGKPGSEDGSVQLQENVGARRLPECVAHSVLKRGAEKEVKSGEEEDRQREEEN